MTWIHLANFEYLLDKHTWKYDCNRDYLYLVRLYIQKLICESVVKSNQLFVPGKFLAPLLRWTPRSLPQGTRGRAGLGLATEGRRKEAAGTDEGLMDGCKMEREGWCWRMQLCARKEEGLPFCLRSWWPGQLGRSTPKSNKVDYIKSQSKVRHSNMEE